MTWLRLESLADSMIWGLCCTSSMQRGALSAINSMLIAMQGNVRR